MRTPQERLTRLLAREASTAQAMASLRKFCEGREGATAMHDVLERQNLGIRQRIYELRLEIENAS